jgi:hypothetical protein
MHRVVRYSFNRMIAAVVVSGLIAVAVSTMTRSGSADTAVATSISVNRALKSDRLSRPKALREQRDASPRSSNRVAPASTNHPPLGCDPAFSAIRARALQAARCLT